MAFNEQVYIEERDNPAGHGADDDAHISTLRHSSTSTAARPIGMLGASEIASALRRALPDVIPAAVAELHGAPMESTARAQRMLDMSHECAPAARTAGEGA